MQLPSLIEIEAATAVIRPHVPPTPQYAWPLLAARTGCEVWVKHENHTPTGAFKVRGGLYLLHRLRAEGQAVRGLVSATRGNHGQSLALACRLHGLSATIVVPLGNSREKNAAMQAFGATVIEHGEDYEAARQYAERLAAERDLRMVQPFERELLCGVATYALEFLRAVPRLRTVYAPLGMGSGLCGLILVRDALGLDTEIVGVLAEQAPAYALSLAAGEVVAGPVGPTLADGVACRVPDATALALIRRGAARLVQVSEAEVATAIRAYYTDTHQVAEGAGAIALAALLQEKSAQRGARVGVILSGGNIDSDVYAGILGASPSA